MLILLPPSETKRTGGTGRSLALSRLSFRQLNAHRRTLVDELVALSADADAAFAALKLGPTQAGEVEANRRLRRSPTMPAIDRYTGVLYDALDSLTLSGEARAFAAEHVFVHSALLGPIGALEPIPAYRLSHDSRLPGRSLKRHWGTAIADALARHDGLILDLRSEAYAHLGPAPRREDSIYLRVLTEADTGQRRALNHFNKKAKGEFTRALIENGQEISDTAELLVWAKTVGIRLETHAVADGHVSELALVV